jgi:eukaryotic-like serine/threonine-protein kinase
MQCPSEDTLQRFVAGHLAGDARDQIAAHVTGCHGCTEDSVIAARIARDPHRADLPAGAPFDLESGRTSERERIGRFEIYESLGLGGMGKVFRARARDTGEWVALKRVKMNSPALIGALRREIHALRRIDHPGVVRIVDEGITQGLPFYAMQLVEGDTLADRITAVRAALGPAPRFANFLPILVVIRRLCDTLSFLHGEGFVHRDLTPRNVIIRPDGSPVLVDFGLAMQFPAPGREAVDLDLPKAGTRTFSAPEQRVRNVVDARADLYALGCILSSAFAGVTLSSSADQTITRFEQGGFAGSLPRLPRPSEFVSDLPPALDEVILRMLAHDPRARLGYATDLARVLDQVGVPPPPASWRRPTRCYLYRPAMFGRDAALARMVALVEHCRQGHGSLALIAGESGVGKTRLALELAAIARDNGLRIVSGACANVAGDGSDPSGTPDALTVFRPLIQAILDHCRHRGPEETRQILGTCGGDLALAFPAVAALAPDQARPPNHVPAEESRFRLISALSEVLARFARRKPLLLVFDDLQWADLFSLTILESLATGFLGGNPIVIVGTYRSDEIDAARGRMLRALAAENIDLHRLEARDVATMVGDIMALPHPPRDLAAFLVSESEGNPFFIAEYLRVAVEAGWLSRDETGAWRMAEKGAEALSRAEPLPTPPSLWEVLGRRLGGLSPGAQRMSGLAAVAGREFDADLIRTVFGGASVEFFDAVTELLARQVLETDGPERMRFVHDKLREAAYASVDRKSLPAHHETVALAMEAPTVGSRGRFDAQLAHHWRLAGKPDNEAPYRLAAGEQAFRVGAYHEAILHLERTLGLLDARTSPAEVARLERHVAEAHFGVGDMPASRRWLGAAVERAGLSAPATAAGQVAVLAGDIVASVVINFVRPLFPSFLGGGSPETGEAALCYERLAHVLFFENETLGVASSSLRALRAASHLGPSPELARILANLSLSAGLLRLHALARFLAVRARDIATEIADEAAQAWAMQLDGVYRAGIGDWVPAVASLESALSAWQRIGHRRRWEECLTLLGMALYHAGDRTRSEKLRRELRIAGSASRSPQTIGWALIGRAEDSLAIGAAKTAVDLLVAARALGPAVRRVEQIWAGGLLARAHLAEGQPDAARIEAERALALAAGAIPTAFYALEGYVGIADTFIRLLVDPSVATPGTIQDARRAVRALRRFARVFPIASGHAATHRAALTTALRAGIPGRALRALPR